MDALTVLRREHTRISQLFVELDGLPQRACLGRRAIVAELDEIVRRHIIMEEALPGSAGAGKHDAAALQLLDELEQTDCRQPAYAMRLASLRDALLHHIREREAYAEVA